MYIHSGIDSINRNDNLELYNARVHSNLSKFTCKRTIIPFSIDVLLILIREIRGYVRRRRYIGILRAACCEKIFNSFYIHNGMQSATYTSDIEFQQRDAMAS